MKAAIFVLALSFSSICFSSPLTSYERGILRKSQRLISEHYKSTNARFKNFESAHHAALLVRLLKGNLFVFGPPGGAKSDFIHHMMDFEPGQHFELPMNEATSEQAFTGAQDFDEMRRGRFKMETKGTAVDHKLVFVDEIDKANPATLGSMLAILNKREVPVGDHIVKALTETVYAASNMNYAKLYAMFYGKGREDSAEALFDRFQISIYVHNWLSKADQLERDKSIKNWPFGDESASSTPEFVDWNALRSISSKLFKHDDDFNRVLIDLVDGVRCGYIEKAQADKKNRARPCAYFPTARMSERLRSKIGQVIYYSALIDFLLSPLADDIDSLDKPYVLDPLSIWRSRFILLTALPGKTTLELTTDKSDQKTIDVVFGQAMSEVKKTDAVEEQSFSDLVQEQDIFRAELKHAIRTYYAAKVKHAGQGSDPEQVEEGFESRLLKAQAQNQAMSE